MWGTQRDVTERVQADRERARAQRSMQVALEVARAGVWDWDVVGDRVIGDESLARIFHLPVADLLAGRLPAAAFFSRMHAADRQRIDRHRGSALAAGGEYELEHRFVQADGAIRWLRSRGIVEQARTDVSGGSPGSSSTSRRRRRSSSTSRFASS